MYFINFKTRLYIFKLNNEKYNMENIEENEKKVNVDSQSMQSEVVSSITTYELGGSLFPVNEDDEVR
jgi:hypothetical protein